ncbi:MAG: histidine kinase dimerization/phospho-acceptor domain-containing protein, partial [Candidatus Eiseniibacteriota bacterium]
LQREIGERQRTEEALRRSEDQLRQSQKLEAVGRLAGGVAHDFNNLLTVILSYTDILAQELGPGHAARAPVEEIERAGLRAADLTRQLLAFSRQQVLDLQILDLNDVLTGVSNMVTRVLGEDIEMRMSLAPTLGSVRADRGQKEQIAMNLIVNARDAMPGGGRLTLETADVDLDETYAGGHLDVQPGPYDAGGERHRDRHEPRGPHTGVRPFFTT